MMENQTVQSDKAIGPLDGVKIVEYGVFHAGPGGTAILGDLGADIIKIEAANGDPIRFWKEIGNINMTAPNGESLMFEVSNRNKKGICLDIKEPEGREIFNRLVKEADVFMTNLRKSTKTKLEIDYPSLRKINPNIIHANVSGYGPEGPMEDIGAFDPLGQACSGMMFVTGQEAPIPLQIGILDQATAISLSHAIITALYSRERQGLGQEVHVSLFGTALWLQHPNLMLANALSINPCVSSDRLMHSPLRNIFCCKNGKWLMSTHHPEEKYWKTFCNAVEQPELLDNPEYTDEHGRPVNYQKLIKILDNVFKQKTSDEWMAVFLKHRLMFCPIQHIRDIKDDPQAQINGYVQTKDYKGLGNISIPGYPVHFSRNKAGLKSPAPKNGEHTDQIMTDIGYSDNEITRLREKGIIQ